MDSRDYMLPLVATKLELKKDPGSIRAHKHLFTRKTKAQNIAKSALECEHMHYVVANRLTHAGK